MGNRTAVRKADSCGRILEQETFTYNDSNQLIKSTYQSGRKISTLYYGYDRDGNRIYEVGKKGKECVETYYKYDVENRLAAVYDGRELLMAAAYDGDGNRVFQLNYNPIEEKDWKDYCDKNNYPDYNDDHDKNNTGKQEISSGKDGGRQDTIHGAGNQADVGKNNKKDYMDLRVFIGAMAGICNMPGLIRRELNTVSRESNQVGDSKADNGRETISKNDADSTSGKQQDGQNHEIADGYDVIFPIGRDEDRTDYRNYKNGHGIVHDIKTAGRGCDYELIEYINDVNREYTQVLVEQSVHGRTDTSYIYGVDRLSLDGYNGCSGYYLYDPRGSVTGITGECGQLYQSYRYSVTGEITFGAPRYENEYTYNGESYNPNIQSQYLRARYYDVVTANFLTEDSYLGDIAEPLTLNRYNYCVSNPVNYVDPSGNNADVIDYNAVYDSLMYVVKGEAYEDTFIQNSEARKQQNEWEMALNLGVIVSVMNTVEDSTLAPLALAGIPLLNQTLPPHRQIDEKKVAQEILVHDIYVNQKIADSMDLNAYYIGRCGGDVIVMVIDVATMIFAAKGAAKAVGSGTLDINISVSMGGNQLALANVASIPLNKVAAGTVGAGYLGVLGIAGKDLFSNFAKIDKSVWAGSASSTSSGYYLKGKKSVPDGSELLRKDVRNVNSNEFKEFIRDQGKSFKSNEWKKIMETWETPDGKKIEVHYWRNSKTGEIWSHK